HTTLFRTVQAVSYSVRPCTELTGQPKAPNAWPGGPEISPSRHDGGADFDCLLVGRLTGPNAVRGFVFRHPRHVGPVVFQRLSLAPVLHRSTVSELLRLWARPVRIIFPQASYRYGRL